MRAGILSPPASFDEFPNPSPMPDRPSDPVCPNTRGDDITPLGGTPLANLCAVIDKLQRATSVRLTSRYLHGA
jgi:hypothetical protein